MTLLKTAYYALIMALLSASAFADGNVILMRHALAPGFGDPATFDVTDCSTQRNLNEEGRAQARMIAKNLVAQGLKPTKILTSPWCRCVDTAKEMALGAWQVHQGLASFYEGHVRKEQTLPLLVEEMRRIKEGELVLMITHQVVIQALTGTYVDSGGYLIVDSDTISWP